MEKYMNQPVLDRVVDLVNTIKEDNRYIKYKQIEEQLKKNKEIMSLIDEIKILEKKAVKEEVNNNQEELTKIDKEINDKLKKLNDYPIYMEYTNLQAELNEDLQFIKDTIEDYLYKCTN